MSNTKQSKKETDRTIFQTVCIETKKAKLGFSSQLFWFVFLTILSFCLAYVLPYSLIVTLPFVIIPSFFAFTSMNIIKGTKNSEGVKFFNMFRAYFSQLFFGGYRVWIGVLKSFLTYFISSVVAYIAFDVAVLSKNSEYQEILNNAMNSADVASVSNQLIDFLSKPEFTKFIFLTTSISLVLASIVFLNHLFKNSVKMRRNVFSKSPIPSRQFVLVDKQVRRKNRKFLLHTYISCAWFIQLLIVLAGAGGIVFSFFFLKELDPMHAVVISLFLMFLVTTPLLNYISTMEDVIFFNLSKQYEDTFVTMTLDFLTKFKDKIGIEEEEAKKLQEILEAQKKEMEEPKKDEDKKDEK